MKKLLVLVVLVVVGIVTWRLSRRGSDPTDRAAIGQAAAAAARAAAATAARMAAEAPAGRRDRRVLGQGRSGEPAADGPPVAKVGRSSLVESGTLAPVAGRAAPATDQAAPILAPSPDGNSRPGWSHIDSFSPKVQSSILARAQRGRPTILVFIGTRAELDAIDPKLVETDISGIAERSDVRMVPDPNHPGDSFMASLRAWAYDVPAT